MKKAVLVGINNFKAVSGLRGCANDVENMSKVLMTLFGFNAMHIHKLIDQKATKAAIVGELQWLLRNAVAGDHLVFHFSSHGSQIKDQSGDEGSDGNDEILCCYDMNFKAGGYLLDDDLLAFARNIPQGVNVEVFFDTCHSGTAQSVVPRGVHPRMNEAQYTLHPLVPRFLTPPLEMLNEGATRSITRGVVGPSGSVVPPNVALWSGCGEGQTSADAFIAGNYNGAFTYHWCQIVRQYKGRISRNDILKKLRTALAGKYTQIPELTCGPEKVAGSLFL